MFRELLKELLESYNKVEEPIYEHKELIEDTQDILSEASFSKAHIDALKKAYGGISKINPESEAYKKLIAMLNGLPDNQLKTLAKADVPFVSALARNRVVSRGLKLESLDENSAPKDLKAGDTVKISKSARQDVVGQGNKAIRIGGNIGKLPAESEVMMIRKIVKTKNGRKAHMQKPDGSMGGGYAIMLDNMPDFMSVEKASMKESANIDEVSKATLDSYMKKARKDMRNRYYDDSEENDKKFFQRSKGIETALKKKWSKNEEYDLDEAKSVEDQIADIEKMLKSFGGNTSSAKMKRYALEKKLASLKSMKEEFDLYEASGYTVNHKTFSSAVQHAIEVAEKRGFQVDDDDWDRKVALGPKKPSSGKTNMYSIDLMKNGKSVKQKLHMQVYYDEGRYELNMYIQ
jgi:DNA-binding ferritin-like protein